MLRDRVEPQGGMYIQHMAREWGERPTKDSGQARGTQIRMNVREEEAMCSSSERMVRETKLGKQEKNEEAAE